MKLFATLALTLVATSAFAIELPTESLKGLTNFKSRFRPVPPESGTNYNYEGIVKLSNCSGSLVILNGMPTSAKAIVMTNGHCVQKPGGYLNPGEVWVNRPINRDMKIFKSLNNLKPIKATRILYATMTDTDVTFYELNQSYDQIKRAYDISPLEIDASHAPVGANIEIISGYWDVGWRCKIDGFVPGIKEGDWSWVDSIRYTSSCTTMGGTSGSPIIAAGERRVIGINNTSNEDGERCTLNNPCEVDRSGNISVRAGVRYGQQIYAIYTCMTPAFEIDLSIPGCDLPK
jgi:V8-like Glu-specific endopeptidase